MLLAVLLLLGTPVAAHSTLVAASPGQGQTVGGSFDRVDLAFDDGVEDLRASFESPAGVTSDAEATAMAANWVVLSAPDGGWDPGRWIVRYAFVSADGDPVTSSFAFTVDLGAPGPLPVAVPEIRSGVDPVKWGIVGALGLLVAALAGRFVLRVRRLRGGDLRGG